MRYTSIRYTPIRCMPMRYASMRYISVAGVHLIGGSLFRISIWVLAHPYLTSANKLSPRNKLLRANCPDAWATLTNFDSCATKLFNYHDLEILFLSSFSRVT
jgi:hypothetical protein